MPCLFCLSFIFYSSCDKQFLSCSRHRNIENSHLFAYIITDNLFRNCTLYNCLALCSFFNTHNISTYSKFPVDYNISGSIFIIYLFTHSCKNNNRKLKAFALMDTHYTHKIIIFAKQRRFTYLDFKFFHTLYVS